MDRNNGFEINPSSPSSWESVLRCPVCLQEVHVGEQVTCTGCGRTYPIAEGIPYLSVIDERWHENLREIVNYVYFYEKISQGLMESDRLESNRDHQSKTFEMMAHAFEESLSHIPFEENPLVADIGAGMGETSQVLAERGARVIATDLNCIDLKRPRYITIGQPAGNLQETVDNARPIPLETVRFARLQCDTCQLPFPDNCFDVVFSRGTWHHYTDIEHALAECARILKPGGLLVACSEPIRAQGDDPLEYVREVVDYQEGINETAPRWEEYERALKASGFDSLHVTGMYVVYGRRKSEQLSKWWNRWRKKTPGPAQGMVFSNKALRRLADIAGCINIKASKSDGPASVSRISAGDTLLETECLTNVRGNFEQISYAYRQTFPQSVQKDCLDLSRPVNRFQAFGLRPPEKSPCCFLFGHRIVRFYLGGCGSTIRLVLVTVPGQSKAGITLTIMANDRIGMQTVVDWEGEKTFEFEFKEDGAGVCEVRLEHDRLWAGCYPEGADVRELGVGIRRVERLTRDSDRGDTGKGPG